jgi:hypothetical protein
MAPIFYVVIASFIYMVGQVTAPKPRVIIMDETGMMEEFVADNPVIISKTKGSFEVRRPLKSPLFAPEQPKVAPEETFPFRRDSLGEITVDCAIDCHE